MFGIYLWRSKIDGRVLIGQTGSTKGFLRRKSQYLSDLRNNKYEKKNKHFQRAWNKYGEENFEFIILHILNSDLYLTAYEQSYVNYYKTLPGGVYNQSGPVENPLRGAKLGPCSDETKLKISIANRGRIKPPTSNETKEKLSQKAKYKWKAVERIDPLTGEAIDYKSVYSTRLDGFNHRHVSECCLYKRRTHKKYYWKFACI